MSLLTEPTSLNCRCAINVRLLAESVRTQGWLESDQCEEENISEEYL
jgi:hypothetical protein